MSTALIIGLEKEARKRKSVAMNMEKVANMVVVGIWVWSGATTKTGFYNHHSVLSHAELRSPPSIKTRGWVVALRQPHKPPLLSSETSGEREKKVDTHDLGSSKSRSLRLQGFVFAHPFVHPN